MDSSSKRLSKPIKKHSLVLEIQELKTQLSYSKRLGFFFGAGTSCALNVPNIEQLTKLVEQEVGEQEQVVFNKITKELKEHGKSPNIENILNHIRRIKEITNETEKQYEGVSGVQAKNLDIEICKKIYTIILEKEKAADLTSTKKFFAWLSILNRGFSKEIFTTNYDLIIEKSLEASDIPYFDGFVGSYEPFFWQESVETLINENDLTQNWIRLWKIHGSLSWFWKHDKDSTSQRIVRIGKVNDINKSQNELVIYPSREKYDSSRKQPFISYFDRLKNYLSYGESLFIFTGYSFSDQHINEIVFNCLRQNSRLTVLVFFFKDEEVENLYNLTSSTYMNLNVFGPKTGIINGNLVQWNFQKDDLKPNERFEYYWDDKESRLKLGDFIGLVDFLIANSGKTSVNEEVLNEK